MKARILFLALTLFGVVGQSTAERYSDDPMTTEGLRIRREREEAQKATQNAKEQQELLAEQRLIQEQIREAQKARLAQQAREEEEVRKAKEEEMELKAKEKEVEEAKLAGEALQKKIANEKKQFWLSILIAVLIYVVWVAHKVKKTPGLKIRRLENADGLSLNNLESMATGLQLHQVGYKKYDFYKLLGLLETATNEEVEAAYKAQLVKYKNLALAGHEDITNKTRIINIAHSVISDQARRSVYDRKLKYLKDVAKPKSQEAALKERSLGSLLIFPSVLLVVAILSIGLYFSQAGRKSPEKLELTVSPPPTVSSSSDSSYPSSTSSGSGYSPSTEEPTRKKLELQEMRLKAATLMPTLREGCLQGNDDACKAYKDMERIAR